ncbi:probable arginine deiminase [Cyanidioschyzon merolae strain 10D]|uniref:Probable arginine deiminase n=1 Tax=Cyanidioschyzon merolae (strain NIES-3377 / 10D) TaxID=280699 RepID=M1V8V9_CYAM1|nr:probable arginine deiminase [Cyanidioschyzon merolae strain 10D]BAM80999.1 probable arginine deiminase [Cyanidioschyzon merolae strain 10D]|eukprot:XP_005537035.1 probable arginine deiminase [Cyanidioschyzon merolae strain 10D]
MNSYWKDNAYSTLATSLDGQRTHSPRDSPLVTTRAPMEAGQEHEDDLAQIAIVSSPGLPKMMGSLHPAGSLYEKPVNLRLAVEQHHALRRLLSSHGIKVYDVHDILLKDTERSVSARVALEKLAARCLTYQFSTDVDRARLDDSERSFIADSYKEKVLEVMAPEQLADIVKTNPVVTIEPSGRDTGFTASYAFKPLTNLMFTRDQQVTTRRGIVMARLRSEQRRREVDVMQFCFEKLKLKIIGRIPENAFLEGGDFFPAGDDLCFIGIGLRSNLEAVHYMLEHDLFGTRRVAVVKDMLDQSQDRMHLDCVFNIIGRKTVLMLADIIGSQSPIRRMVDEYARESEQDAYRLVRRDVEFGAYVEDQGFEIIPLSLADQMAYGCNVLNLGASHIVSVCSSAARKIVADDRFTGNVEYLDFSQCTAMYGAAHCATQIVYRSRVPPISLDHEH